MWVVTLLYEEIARYLAVDISEENRFIFMLARSGVGKGLNVKGKSGASESETGENRWFGLRDLNRVYHPTIKHST